MSTATPRTPAVAERVGAPFKENLAIGFLLMLGAFFCFSVMDTSAKWLVEATIPALQVAFLRYMVHLFWVLVVYLPSEGRSMFRSAQPRYQITRAVLLLSATSLNFTALFYLPLTVTIAIFFASPMMVCLLSIPVLGEKVGIRRFAAVGAGFVGVLIIVAPWGAQFDWHIMLAVAAALCASGYFVTSRLMANIDSNSVAQVYVAGLGTILLSPIALYLWRWPSDWVEWGLLLFIGTFGMLGHSLLTRAYRHAEASVLSPTIYSQIIYITILSWLVFDAPPERQTIIGTLIIVASGLYIWMRERQRFKMNSSIIRSGPPAP